MITTDYTKELICLGVDVVICGVLYKLYRNIKENAQAVKDAPALTVSKELEDKVITAVNQSIPYVALRGPVKSIGTSIKSEHAEVTGVVQNLILKEHKTKWTWGTRWWSDTEKVIQHVVTNVPFTISNDKRHVEVVDALAADRLDLATIHDKYEVHEQSLKQMLLGFLRGEQSKGFQHIETMLTEGTVITGIGELVWRHGGLQLQLPVDNNRKYYLTTMSQHSLVKKLEADGRLFKVFLGVFGAVGIFIVALIGKKIYKSYKEQRIRNQERKRFEEILQERLRRVENRTRNNENNRNNEARNTSEPGELTCVICLSNPREVLINGCNHVCCCVDCIAELNPKICPICRKPFVDVSPVYIS